MPIIFLTAAIAQPEQPFLGYAAGAVDYLAKPFDPGVLKAKVAVFVDLYLKASQLRDQAELLGGRLEAVEETVATLRQLPGGEPGRRGEGGGLASQPGRPAARRRGRAQRARNVATSRRPARRP